ncbi:MAG: hypothetical protein IPL24_13880 [Bacteroidetes bacterium]|nr:hypothetical protein [Bacteroidota bacterium]
MIQLFDLPASKSIFRTDDGGFKLIYQQTDSMVIRQFDETGVLQRTRYYSPMVAPYYPAEAASDSGYFLVTVEYDFQLNRKKHIVIKCNIHLSGLRHFMTMQTHLKI